MGDGEEMIHSISDIYNALYTTISTITGQSYVFDRSPQVNFSEGQSGVYRYYRPSRIAKERRSQGTPETVVEFEVGILSLKPSEVEITSAEDELDGLLQSLLRIGQIADNVLVYAANTAPTNTQYVSDEGLSAEVPVLACVATIAVRAYY